jgi:hypothetical protein
MQAAEASGPVRPIPATRSDSSPTTAPGRVEDCVRNCGVRIAADADLPSARRLAADLIGPRIISTTILEAIQARTRSTVLIFKEDDVVAGMLAVAQLSVSGRAALELGEFDVFAGRLDEYAGPGEPPAAAYALGVAATTRTARRAMTAAVARLRRRLLARLPFFANAATEAGRRVLTQRLGCIEHASGLFWSRPLDESGACT